MSRKARELPENAGGVQSVEIGAQVLLAVKQGGGPTGLKTIAERAAMPAANTRRYLVSLIRAGLVEQDAATGKYDLGPVSLEIGLSAIVGLNLVRLAIPLMSDLRERTGETVILSVWGDFGPTIIHWEEAAAPITVNARLGSVFPVLDTATGRAFLTWLPREQTRKTVEAELARLGEDHGTDIDAIIAETREQGISRYSFRDTRALSTLAAPVFDAMGRLSAVLTVFGHRGKFDISAKGLNARALREAATQLSAKLGYQA